MRSSRLAHLRDRDQVGGHSADRGDERDHPAFPGALSHGEHEPQFGKQPDQTGDPGQRAGDVLTGGVRGALAVTRALMQPLAGEGEVLGQDPRRASAGVTVSLVRAFEPDGHAGGRAH